MGVDRGENGRRAHNVPRLHALGVLLAVLSLFVQSFVVQPHIDGLTFARGNAHGAVTQVKAPAETPATCVICQEAALAGAVTLAATPSLLLIERHFVKAAPAPLQRVVCRAPSHNWQSRAPPVSV